MSDSFTSPPAGPSTLGNPWPHCQDSPHSRTDCLTPLDPRSSRLTLRSLSRAAGSCAVPAPPHQPLPAAAAPRHPCRGQGQRAERRASADSGQRPALRGGGADTLEDNGVTRGESLGPESCRAVGARGYSPPWKRLARRLRNIAWVRPCPPPGRCYPVRPARVATLFRLLELCPSQPAAAHRSPECETPGA